MKLNSIQKNQFTAKLEPPLKFESGDYFGIETDEQGYPIAVEIYRDGAIIATAKCRPEISRTA